MSEHKLYDWDDSEAEPVSYTISIDEVALNIEFADGRKIWIEYEEGKIRIHAFDTENEEPANLDVSLIWGETR